MSESQRFVGRSRTEVFEKLELKILFKIGAYEVLNVYLDYLKNR